MMTPTREDKKKKRQISAKNDGAENNKAFTLEYEFLRHGALKDNAEPEECGSPPRSPPINARADTVNRKMGRGVKNMRGRNILR